MTSREKPAKLRSANAGASKPSGINASGGAKRGLKRGGTRGTISTSAAANAKSGGKAGAKSGAKPRAELKGEVERLAREKFGFDQLYPAQQDAIETILHGRDTLVITPTGSGKSAVYQIPALMLPGPAVVISPLIALQKDQVESIEQQNVAEAAVVNSTQRVSQLNRAFEELASGELKYLFLAPEQFHNEETVERVRAAKPSLFVVDEAHCISEWGHDFRPEHLRLGAVIEALGHPTVLAMTATAAEEVRNEIIERLNMRDPRVIVKGFDRPNIWLGVQTFKTEREKAEALLTQVQDAEKPGIVYVSTRKHAEEIAAALAERGVNALFYHGGMRAKERDAIQDDFMQDRAEVVVATSAFGMGVDKANVRFVFHYDVADFVDSYYQEIGRAGRDGKPAKAILFYRPEDLGMQRFFAGGGKLDTEQIEQVAAIVEKEDEPVNLAELKEQAHLSGGKLTKALNRLEEVGVVETLPSGEVVAADKDADLKQAAEQAAKEQTRHHDYQLLRIEKMRAYAELFDCRREYLLHYFGEESCRCGHCDMCEARAAAQTSDPGQDVRRGPQYAGVAARPKAALRKRAAAAGAGAGGSNVNGTAATSADANADGDQAKTGDVDGKRGARRGRGRSAALAASDSEQPFPLKTRVVHKVWGRGVVQEYDGDKVQVLFDDPNVGLKMLSVKTVTELGLLQPL